MKRLGILAVASIVACVPLRRALAPALPQLPFPTDTLRSQRIARGVTHWFVYAPSGPWAIHLLDVDRDACNSALAVKGSNETSGREKTSTLLQRLSDTLLVVGGVNADFFTPTGAPTGALVARGRVITLPSARPVLAFDSAGSPQILTLRSTSAGDTLAPFHPQEAVGGRPVLLRDSVIVGDVDTVGQPGFADARHPRTAVGIGRGGRRLLLVAVDGRQKPYSDGMTLRELATLMRGLGAREAINLDGGGSTTLVRRDPATNALSVANRPSDAAGERPVGNALAIVHHCPD